MNLKGLSVAGALGKACSISRALPGAQAFRVSYTPASPACKPIPSLTITATITGPSSYGRVATLSALRPGFRASARGVGGHQSDRLRAGQIGDGYADTRLMSARATLVTQTEGKQELEQQTLDRGARVARLGDLVSEQHFQPGARERLIYALRESAIEDLTPQTRVRVEAVTQLARADHALVAGQMREAVAEFDALRTWFSEQACQALEDALCQQLQRTPLSFYRQPLAQLPNGKWVPPDSHRGGYHGSNCVSPDVALTRGLAVRGPNVNLLDHVMETGGTAFRGATPTVSDPDGLSGAALWASEGGWVYDIRHVPTWNADLQLQGRRAQEIGYADNLLTGELELVIPGYIPPDKIKRYGQVEVLHGIACVRTWHDNPNFKES